VPTTYRIEGSKKNGPLLDLLNLEDERTGTSLWNVGKH